MGRGLEVVHLRGKKCGGGTRFLRYGGDLGWTGVLLWGRMRGLEPCRGR